MTSTGSSKVEVTRDAFEIWLGHLPVGARRYFLKLTRNRAE